jgi:hypothetical protein
VNVTLDDLRNEYAAETVGPLLLDLLDRVVRATAPQYPAQEYSDATVWNHEAFEDARNDWVERRLLGRGDLGKMLAQAATVARLRAALTTSFRQFLANRRTMSSAARLYKRSHDMLRAKSDTFSPVGVSSRSGEQLWTLASAPRDERARHELPALVSFARELSDDDLGVVRYADETLKSSPILRAPALERFLVHLLERVGGALDTATIAQVMRIRFELWELELVELEDAFTAAEPPAVATVPVDVAARSVFLRLTPETARRLVAVDDAGGDFELAARTADCPPSELIDAVSETAAMIAAMAADGDEAHEIYARLKELLRGG